MAREPPQFSWRLYTPNAFGILRCFVVFGHTSQWARNAKWPFLFVCSFLVHISRKFFPLTALQSFAVPTVLSAFLCCALAAHRGVLLWGSLISCQVFNLCLKVASGGWKCYSHQLNWNSTTTISPSTRRSRKGIIFNQISGLTFHMASCRSLCPCVTCPRMCASQCWKDPHNAASSTVLTLIGEPQRAEITDRVENHRNIKS